MVLIAAKLQPDIFPTEEINTSWDESMQVCRALQDVSVSAHKCIAALNILSSKILPSSKRQSRSASEQPQDTVNHMVQDFGDSGFSNDMMDFSNVNLGGFALEPDDLSWLNYMTTWNSLIE